MTQYFIRIVYEFFDGGFSVDSFIVSARDKKTAIEAAKDLTWKKYNKRDGKISVEAAYMM